jgi:hypothetical protein
MAACGFILCYSEDFRGSSSKESGSESEYMNDDCHFLADFCGVLLISLVWLCVCEILASVGCDFVTDTVSDR